jgi:preprotein translocase subunit SecD
MNRYPLWKNLMLLALVLVGFLLALPNVFSQDPSIEVTATRGGTVTEASVGELKAALENAQVPFKAIEPPHAGKLLIRFKTSGDQLKGQGVIDGPLSEHYNGAMTLSPDLPRWLKALGIRPMFLGLDLRGGVHVLIDVDIDAAVAQARERYTNDIRTLLRKEKVRYLSVGTDGERIIIKFPDTDTRDKARTVIRDEFRTLNVEPEGEGDTAALVATMSPAEINQTKTFALEQNITTLRNRVNALGVAEPIIQRQGDRRIVVQLPGAQDPARIKEILGATATLEYRLVDTEHSVADAVDGRVPPGSKLYKERDGTPVLLSRRVIVTGNQITDAAAGFDSRSGQPMVSVSLDEQGGRRMREVTTENVGKPMAVVFIENRTVTSRGPDGKLTKRQVLSEEVISIANILEPFGRRFQTTGLDSPEEAHNLALLLRAGALAAPIEIVEERTIGPSLGQDNIDQGFRSVLIGFAAVAVFMVLYYGVFGLIADIALMVNVLLLLAVLGLLQATLTLPGIAGILLTVGMAVDANVLIYERIREELRNGSSPQASIQAGYEKALSTIVDANITTLIAGVVLFSFGTGPIKGFAVTLSIGILTSLVTALLISRAMVNLVYGGRRLSKLSI